MVSESLQGVFQCVVQLHDGRLVAASVAVVGRGEYGDDVPVVAPVVPLHDELVRPRDERQPVRVVERLGDVLAEGVAGAAGRDAPAPAVVRIGPQKIAHRTLMYKSEFSFSSWYISPVRPVRRYR